MSDRATSDSGSFTDGSRNSSRSREDARSPHQQFDGLDQCQCSSQDEDSNKRIPPKGPHNGLKVQETSVEAEIFPRQASPPLEREETAPNSDQVIEVVETHSFLVQSARLEFVLNLLRSLQERYSSIPQPVLPRHPLPVKNLLDSQPIAAAGLPPVIRRSSLQPFLYPRMLLRGRSNADTKQELGWTVAIHKKSWKQSHFPPLPSISGEEGDNPKIVETDQVTPDETQDETEYDDEFTDQFHSQRHFRVYSRGQSRYRSKCRAQFSAKPKTSNFGSIFGMKDRPKHRNSYEDLPMQPNAKYTRYFAAPGRDDNTDVDRSV